MYFKNVKTYLITIKTLHKSSTHASSFPFRIVEESTCKEVQAMAGCFLITDLCKQLKNQSRSSCSPSLSPKPSSLRGFRVTWTQHNTMTHTIRYKTELHNIISRMIGVKDVTAVTVAVKNRDGEGYQGQYVLPFFHLKKIIYQVSCQKHYYTTARYM